MGCSYSLADDAMDISNTFWEYIESAINSDGEKAANIFSQSALDYWNQRLNEASKIRKKELLKLPTYQMCNIIIIRQRIKENDKILQMSGQEWLEHSYSMGWNSSRGLNLIHSDKANFELIPEVSGNLATLALKYAGQVLPTTFPFIKEEGMWKIDGEKQFLALEDNAETGRTLLEQSKKTYCNTLFQALFGYAIPKDLWLPTEVW